MMRNIGNEAREAFDYLVFAGRLERTSHEFSFFEDEYEMAYRYITVGSHLGQI